MVTEVKVLNEQEAIQNRRLGFTISVSAANNYERSPTIPIQEIMQNVFLDFIA